MEEQSFIPGHEEKKIQHAVKQDASIQVKPTSQAGELLHNTELGGILYKYDLPVVNTPIIFKSQLIRKEELDNTPVENLYETLDISGDTAYESFIIKSNQHFNNEVDMYGDIQPAGQSGLKVLEFGIPIPYETLNDVETMKKYRDMFLFNPDMPGAIELVHPNKFLPSKGQFFPF